jgi:hypothetical protein
MNIINEKRIQYILATLSKLDYGSVVVTVHDHHITQIDVTEKMRFPLSKLEGPVKKS